MSQRDVSTIRSIDFEVERRAAEREVSALAATPDAMGYCGSCTAARSDPTPTELPFGTHRRGTHGGSRCEAYPLGPYRTNDSFIFLREILQQASIDPGDAAAAGVCLRQWLENSANDVLQPLGSPYSTVVVDQRVELTEPIVIPRRFTLSGVGLNGAGRLVFRGLPPNARAITFFPNAYSTLCDLAIEYQGQSGAPINGRVGVGIDEIGTIVYIRRCRFANWAVGVDNQSGYSTMVEQCVFFENRVHVRVGAQGYAMRLRDSVLIGANFGAVRLNTGDEAPTSNGFLMTGCRLSNNSSGVTIGGHGGATLIGNGFVRNGGVGIRVLSAARQARILANVFAQGDRLLFDEEIAVRVGEHYHQYGFNVLNDPGASPEERRQQQLLAVEAVYTVAVTELPAP